MWRASLEGQRGEWAALIILMLGYAVVFAAYYPPLSGIEDEIGFVNQALVWSRGAISSEGAGLNDLTDFAVIGSRHLAQRHPGRSILVLPFLMVGGARAVFLSGLLLHLLLAWFAALLLVRLGRSPLWAVLLLFHPTLAIYSRTITADAAAGTGLLLAALAVSSSSPMAGTWAGLAVGLAALMRYHAGAALPLVAAAFCLPADRPDARRQALLSLLAGAGAGGLIVAYNLALYGTPLDPFSAPRGDFSRVYFVPQSVFYATALMAIWPAMLLAPWLDRSRLRWLARLVCGFFFLFFSFYYFHDDTGRWIETLVVGQRLIQVALPLWVISYACVASERLAPPLRHWLGERAWAALVAFGCAGLLAGTALLFSKHQDHLNKLRAIRDTAVVSIPAGSLVIYDGPFLKLFGVPSGLPSYRWKALRFQGVVLDKMWQLEQEHTPWYVAVALENPQTGMPEAAQALVSEYGMKPVVTQPQLRIYVASPKNGYR